MEDNDITGFCNCMARVLSRPDERLMEVLGSGAAYHYFSRIAGSDRAMVYMDSGFDMEGLGRLYRQSFEDNGILLVESGYKQWSTDTGCNLPMKGETGLLLSDNAMHMLDIYEAFGIQIQGEYSTEPDNVSLLLEFLGLLYEVEVDDHLIRQFVGDHLDWIEVLVNRATGCNIHPFYMNALLIIRDFLSEAAKAGDVT